MIAMMMDFKVVEQMYYILLTSTRQKARDNMKIIVLHDRYSNEPVVIRVDAITAIRKVIDRVEDSKDEYSAVWVSHTFFDVKEHIDVVMTKIRNAERRAESEVNNGTDDT